MTDSSLHAKAVVFERPNALSLADLPLTAPGAQDVVVDVEFSGISTGTERLLWTGSMPSFPGLAYPLVPGYETVGHIVDAGADQRARIGERVFVSGADCFGDVRGLFGGSASRLVVPTEKALRISSSVADKGTLLALAATAVHAIHSAGQTAAPDLIIGHGVLGRLLARLSLALTGVPPTVWEVDSARFAGADGYDVTRPEKDPRHDYQHVYDVSGDADILDELVKRIVPGGEVVLAGFYSRRLSFAFAPAFMREARLRVAAEWKRVDLRTAHRMVEDGSLSLDGLITHTLPADDASQAYKTAFGDPSCLKMVMDWRAAS